MKRLGITVLLSCFMIYGCSKEYTEMDVISSHNTTADKWYKLDIDIIVDKDSVSDKDACSKEIIQHILDNDFRSIHFSFDKNGYPNEVIVNVFTSKENIQKSKKSYSFEYITEFNMENPDIQNNVKDNLEEFEIQYK